MRLRKRHNKGFSLVELLIVVAVIAVLVSVVGACLFKYIRRSKIAHDISNADTIANAAITALKEQDINNEVRLRGGIEALAHPDGTFTSTTDAPLFLSALNQYCGGAAPKMKYTDKGQATWVVRVNADGTDVEVWTADEDGGMYYARLAPNEETESYNWKHY